MGVGDQRHASASLPPEKRPGIHCIGSRVGPTADMDECRKSRPHPPMNINRSALRSTSLSSQYKQSAGKVNLSLKRNAKLITEFAAAQLEKQFLNFHYGTLITRFPAAKIWNPSLTRSVQSTCDYRISLTLPTDFTCDISKGVFHALTTKASSQKLIYSYSPVMLL